MPMSRKSKVIQGIVQNLPFTIGNILAKIPFKYRIGIGFVYNKRIQDIKEFHDFSVLQKKEWIYNRLKILVEFAFNEIPFYCHFYQKKGFHPDDFSCFEDINLIPIINKSDLLAFELEHRSSIQEGRYVVNTGGSSGKTLSFYITPDSMGHEWAHMHQVWGKLGYSPSDLKMTFGGHYTGDEITQYDPVRHQLNINIYKDYSKHLPELIYLFSFYKIKYLHGYPSAIFDFATFCVQTGNQYLLNAVRQNLKGVLFGSEYPAPAWRKKIEESFLVKSVSWYGHTERTVLAYEKGEHFSFSPFHTYGFAEGVDFEDGCHLVGTSYYNFASPLIRYDTEDLIEPTKVDGVLDSFKIKEGRNGEFILDKFKNRIPLTGLIFGRHHKLFESCQYIQLSQKVEGEANIYYVLLPDVEEFSPAINFLSEGIAVNFTFVQLQEPIRTSGGKIRLLVDVPTSC